MSADPTAAAPAGAASTPVDDPSVRAALLRYRVVAYAVGVILIVLVCVAVPMKYAAGEPQLVSVVGQIHGFGYMVYLAVALHLGLKRRWAIGRLLLVLLAGTVPFLSFVAERNVTHRITGQGR